MYYTLKERTEKKYTPRQASDAALAIIKEQSKGQLTQVCTNALKGVSDDTLMTLEAMNDYVDTMVADTFYHDGYKCK